MNILIIYTGGTIGMVENPDTGALESFCYEQLQQYVPELKQFGYNLDVDTFDPPIDSSDMTPSHWLELASRIRQKKDQYDGFVVLHGTDTMAFTASALSFLLLGLSKPVIITGSQLPINQLRTDGRENLITSVELAATRTSEGESAIKEVCIYFERTLMRGNRATKINAEGFNAFRSHNCTPLATVGTHIKTTPLPLPTIDAPERFWPRNNSLNTGIVVVTLFPGMSEDIFRAQVSSPQLQAVILRTFGSGNAPQQGWLLSQLKELNSRGVIVVNITQCDEGAVEMGRYQTSRLLLEAGVVPGFDSTWEAMLTKLMVLLNSTLSHDEIIACLHMSLAGEISIS